MITLIAEMTGGMVPFFASPTDNGCTPEQQAGGVC